MTIEQTNAYLAHLAQTNLVIASCDHAGICYDSVRNRRLTCPDFEEQEKVARIKYRESLQAEVHRRAVVGIDEPLHYMGKLTGEVVKKYSDRLLDLHVKAHCPEYREKFSADLNLKGGVLAVPMAPKSEEEWAGTEPSTSPDDER